MQAAPIDGHRLWACHYDSQPNPLLALEMRMLRNFLGAIHGRRVVDIGCGTGRWMQYLHFLGNVVFGIDACEEMLRVAESKPHLCGRLALADAAALPFSDENADIVVCSFVAGYCSHLDAVMQEMARITRRGGSIIISDLHPSASAAGWTRSFRIGSETCEIDHFNRTIEQFRLAAGRARLRLEKQLHGYFGEPERNVFRTAGKERTFSEVRNIPAVWVGVWKRL